MGLEIDWTHWRNKTINRGIKIFLKPSFPPTPAIYIFGKLKKFYYI